MGRLFSSISTIVFAFFLGYVLLFATWFWFPDLFNLIQDGANWVEGEIEGLPFGTRLQGPVGFLIGDDQIMLVFYTIISRLVISLVLAGFSSVTKRY